YRTVFARILSAAVVLIICSIGFYFYREYKAGPPASKTASVTGDAILPVNSKAVLTLADGTNLILDEEKDGEIAYQQGIGILKNKEGEISYTVPVEYSPLNSRLVYNTITTKTGGQYQVSLPDGSKVWLNSKSSLKFPVVFGENERLVELTGE